MCLSKYILKMRNYIIFPVFFFLKYLVSYPNKTITIDIVTRLKEVKLGTKDCTTKLVISGRLLFDEFFLTKILLSHGNLPKKIIPYRFFFSIPAKCRK